MKKSKKIDQERQEAYDSLPPGTKESLTPEEKELFLNSEQWPDEMFEKLEEFIIKK